MPTYTYSCNKCGQKTQEQRSVNDNKPPKCHTVGCGRRMKLIIETAPAAIVKNPAAGYRS